MISPSRFLVSAMSCFVDKIAVITGAGSGIGRALSHALNAAGCTLEVCDVDDAGLEQTLASLPRPELSCHIQHVDVSDRRAIEAWASAIEARHGRVDIVINNAGVGLGGTAEDNSYEDIEWLMGINFWGVVYGCKTFLPLLHRSPAAHLVNISSVFGIIGVPTQSAYNAAKFAVRGYTEALRQELAGSTVHVCCVHPGGVSTNIARNSRTRISADEHAEAVKRFEEFARTTPETAAQQIMDAMRRKRPRLLVGGDAKMISLLSRLFPASYPRILNWLTGGMLADMSSQWEKK